MLAFVVAGWVRLEADWIWSAVDTADTTAVAADTLPSTVDTVVATVLAFFALLPKGRPRVFLATLTQLVL